MTDDILKNAEALRDSIAKKLTALREEVRGAEADLEQAAAMVERARGGRAVPVGAAAARNPSRQEVLEVVLRLLADRGKPMQLRDLYEAVRAEGIILSGKDPSSVLGTMLWRGKGDGLLVNLAGEGYWDAAKPYPPAKYHPSAK